MSQKESRRVRREKDYKGEDVAAGVIKIEKKEAPVAVPRHARKSKYKKVQRK